MLSIRWAIKGPNLARRNLVKNWQSYHSIKHVVDSCGIPVQPTWSVHQLLESYACPKLSSTTIDRLYELSALVPPKKDTLLYEKMKKDLEDMVKLVETAKQVSTNGVSLVGRGEKEDGDRIQRNSQFEDEHGQTLLKYAARSENRFYAVDAERKR
jgi:Asp-tRNA(Asn)/Glu-tRNA(Gln) amidotransferase C subunit